MTQLDWLRRLDASREPLDRLAYADWLKERDMVCEALAQLLLATSEPYLSGSRWELCLADVPEPARSALLDGRGNKWVENPTHMNAPYRYFLELNMQHVAETLLKNGYSYHELAGECQRVIASRRGEA